MYLPTSWFSEEPKKNKLQVNMVNIKIIAKPIPHLNRKKIKTEKLNSNLNIKLLEISALYTV